MKNSKKQYMKKAVFVLVLWVILGSRVVLADCPPDPVSAMQQLESPNILYTIVYTQGEQATLQSIIDNYQMQILSYQNQAQEELQYFISHYPNPTNGCNSDACKTGEIGYQNSLQTIPHKYDSQISSLASEENTDIATEKLDIVQHRIVALEACPVPQPVQSVIVPVVPPPTVATVPKIIVPVTVPLVKKSVQNPVTVTVVQPSTPEVALVTGQSPVQIIKENWFQKIIKFIKNIF